jgi:hypothetical protein
VTDPAPDWRMSSAVMTVTGRTACAADSGMRLAVTT